MKDILLSFINKNNDLSIDIFIECYEHQQRYKQSIINYITDVKNIFEHNHITVHNGNNTLKYIDIKYPIIADYKQYIDTLLLTINALILSDDYSPLFTISQIKNKVIY